MKRQFQSNDICSASAAISDDVWECKLSNQTPNKLWNWISKDEPDIELQRILAYVATVCAGITHFFSIPPSYSSDMEFECKKTIETEVRPRPSSQSYNIKRGVNS